MISNLAPLPGSKDSPLDLINRFSLGFIYCYSYLLKNFSCLSGTCLSVPEAARRNYFTSQILQDWSVQSAKKNVPHRSTITLVRRSTLANHSRPRHRLHRPILAHPHRPKQLFCRPTFSTQHRSMLHLKHRSILSRETWLRI